MSWTVAHNGEPVAVTPTLREAIADAEADGPAEPGMWWDHPNPERTEYRLYSKQGEWPDHDWTWTGYAVLKGMEG